MATSSGRACAINWRRNTTSVPTSLAIARDVGGLQRERDGRNGVPAAAEADTIERPIVGVGSRASVAEQDQLAAALDALANGQRGGRDLFRLLLGHLRAQPASSRTFMRMDSATSFSSVARSLLFRAEERIKKTSRPDILAQFAMLEEHVHCFP